MLPVPPKKQLEPGHHHIFWTTRPTLMLHHPKPHNIPQHNKLLHNNSHPNRKSHARLPSISPTHPLCRLLTLCKNTSSISSSKRSSISRLNGNMPNSNMQVHTSLRLSLLLHSLPAASTCQLRFPWQHIGQILASKCQSTFSQTSHCRIVMILQATRTIGWIISVEVYLPTQRNPSRHKKHNKHRERHRYRHIRLHMTFQRAATEMRSLRLLRKARERPDSSSQLRHIDSENNR